jgi:hypothetical protein
MFQRKLIAGLSVITVLAVSAGTGNASLSRVEGMGLSVPALSQFTDDYANIYVFPASVVRQNNLVLAEIGSSNGGSTNPVFVDDQSFTLIRNFTNPFESRSRYRTGMTVARLDLPELRRRPVR